MTDELFRAELEISKLELKAMADPGKPKSKRNNARRRKSTARAKKKTAPRQKKTAPSQVDLFDEVSGAHAQEEDTARVEPVAETDIGTDAAAFAALMALSEESAAAESNAAFPSTAPDDAPPAPSPPPPSDTEPRRRLRSERQRSEKHRRLLYVGGGALLILMLVGLVLVLLARPRTSTRGVAETIAPESAPTAGATASIAESDSGSGAAEAEREARPEQVGERLGAPELREPLDPAASDMELATAESPAPFIPDAEPAVPSEPAAERNMPAIDFSSPWTNSLGIKLVPVENVLFGVWETRVKDFEAFCKATGRERKRALFEESDDHPVSETNWNDAQAFCAWLTRKERAEGIIGPKQHYRLPTDLEWSLAVGIEGETGDTPEARDGQISKIYPWGSQWPPRDGAGNFADRSASRELGSVISGYDDGYARSSPVGTFEANSLGIHDLSGNLWEWCQDAYGGKGKLRNWRVMRGGSWSTSGREELLSSYRNVVNPDSRELLYGFRCVLVEE